jgi:hypothetical protein
VLVAVLSPASDVVADDVVKEGEVFHGVAVPKVYQKGEGASALDPESA